MLQYNNLAKPMSDKRTFKWNFLLVMALCSELFIKQSGPTMEYLTMQMFKTFCIIYEWVKSLMVVWGLHPVVYCTLVNAASEST